MGKKKLVNLWKKIILGPICAKNLFMSPKCANSKNFFKTSFVKKNSKLTSWPDDLIGLRPSSGDLIINKKLFYPQDVIYFLRKAIFLLIFHWHEITFDILRFWEKNLKNLRNNFKKKIWISYIFLNYNGVQKYK